MAQVTIAYEGFATTPYREEVVVSEASWNLDNPAEDSITIQNYKTQFEDLFNRTAAAVQQLEYNKAAYARAASILDSSGLINTTLLANSLGAIPFGFGLSGDNSIYTTNDGLFITDPSNTKNFLRLTWSGLGLSNNGGQTWQTAIGPDGISADLINTGALNTKTIQIYNEDKPAFKWDANGLSAFSTKESGEYDYSTYVRFDQYGLYGITQDEQYVASSLEDVQNKADFGLTWDGFFIKSKDRGGYVSISSTDDFQVMAEDENGEITERIKIGLLEPEDEQFGQSPLYGIRIRNNEGIATFISTEEGNVAITGDINATSGNFLYANVGDIELHGDTGEIGSSSYFDAPSSLQGWMINGDGDAIFNNISARGAIKTAVFEYEEIQAVGGAFLFRPASTIKTVEQVKETVAEGTYDIFYKHSLPFENPIETDLEWDLVYDETPFSENFPWEYYLEGYVINSQTLEPVLYTTVTISIDETSYIKNVLFDIGDTESGNYSHYELTYVGNPVLINLIPGAEDNGEQLLVIKGICDTYEDSVLKNSEEICKLFYRDGGEFNTTLSSLYLAAYETKPATEIPTNNLRITTETPQFQTGDWVKLSNYKGDGIDDVATIAGAAGLSNIYKITEANGSEVVLEGAAEIFNTWNRTNTIEILDPASGAEPIYDSGNFILSADKTYNATLTKNLTTSTYTHELQNWTENNLITFVQDGETGEVQFVFNANDYNLISDWYTFIPESYIIQREGQTIVYGYFGNLFLAKGKDILSEEDEANITDNGEDFLIIAQYDQTNPISNIYLREDPNLTSDTIVTLTLTNEVVYKYYNLQPTKILEAPEESSEEPTSEETVEDVSEELPEDEDDTDESVIGLKIEISAEGGELGTWSVITSSYNEETESWSTQITLSKSGISKYIIAEQTAVIEDLSSLIGGSLISFGKEDQSSNYGIGINSGDGYINLPRRAISLFESEIHPNKTTKVSYDFKGIFGTLPNLGSSKVDYKYYKYLQDTQGVFIDNFYFGNNEQYITFYEGEDKKKHLVLKVQDLLFEGSNGNYLSIADSTAGLEIASDLSKAIKIDLGTPSILLQATIKDGEPGAGNGQGVYITDEGIQFVNINAGQVDTENPLVNIDKTEIRIPRANVTELRMRNETNEVGVAYWVMRDSGHLSLKIRQEE